MMLETNIPGIFSDNNFLILPWEPRTITFKSQQHFDVSDLEASLTITTIAGTLQQASTIFSTCKS